MAEKLLQKKYRKKISPKSGAEISPFEFCKK
jgi:hypothetical protein